MGFIKEFFTEIAIRVKNPGNNKYCHNYTRQDTIVPRTTTTTRRQDTTIVPRTTTTRRQETFGDLPNPTRPVINLEPIARQPRAVEPDLRRAWLLD